MVYSLLENRELDAATAAFAVSMMQYHNNNNANSIIDSSRSADGVGVGGGLDIYYWLNRSRDANYLINNTTGGNTHHQQHHQQFSINQAYSPSFNGMFKVNLFTSFFWIQQILIDTAHI